MPFEAGHEISDDTAVTQVLGVVEANVVDGAVKVPVRLVWAVEGPAAMLVELCADVADDDAKVNGTVVPFVVYQAYEGKKVVVGHALCTVTVTTTTRFSQFKSKLRARDQSKYLELASPRREAQESLARRSRGCSAYPASKSEFAWS